MQRLTQWTIGPIAVYWGPAVFHPIARRDRHGAPHIPLSGAAGRWSLRSADPGGDGHYHRPGRSPALRPGRFPLSGPPDRRVGQSLRPLDGQGRFALELELAHAVLVTGGHRRWGAPNWRAELGKLRLALGGRPLLRQIALFVEPGDSLHLEIDASYLSPSVDFTGSGADNNRFLLASGGKRPPPSPDYQNVDLETFTQWAHQWRQGRRAQLDSARAAYRLTPIFAAYLEADIIYPWARFMLSYATLHSGGKRPMIPVPLDYYDFLDEVPLVDQRVVGNEAYLSFLHVALARWSYRAPRRQSELLGLADLGLDSAAQARFDSLYKRRRQPQMSVVLGLADLGLDTAARTRFDSLYHSNPYPALSQRFDLAAFGFGPEDHAALDVFYKGGYTVTHPKDQTAPRIDTTGGRLTFRLPRDRALEDFVRTVPLSGRIDLSGLGLSPGDQVRIDSLYAHRLPVPLSQLVGLDELGLSPGDQARLDALYATPRSRMPYFMAWRHRLIREKLQGRVLYWFLGRQLISSFKYSGDSFAAAARLRPDFEHSNAYPEYTRAVEAAYQKNGKLQPGNRAPGLFLVDIEGRKIRLSQYKGQFVLLDFWTSGCGPCISNLSRLRRLGQQTDPDRLVFLHISLDRDREAWRQAIDKYGIEGVHAWVSGWGSSAVRAYRVGAPPVYYLIDPRGRIAARLGGNADVERLLERIRESR